MAQQLHESSTRRSFFLRSAALASVSFAACRGTGGARSDRDPATAEASATEAAANKSARGTGADGSPIVLPPLPYAETALEPHVSAETLRVHHGKHHKNYVEKANTLLAASGLTETSLPAIVAAASKRGDTKLFQNAAQAHNHELYWQSMKPRGGGDPGGELRQRIDRDFGSLTRFQEQFVRTAAEHFSNGWVWVVLDGDRLQIVDTHDADTPVARGQKVLCVADVWEHAYYLDRKNERQAYAQAFVDHLLNWDFVRANVA
jgi:superoxide dismutase, Fe-Mn family